MTDTSEEKTTLINRNITVLGRRTSVRLEPVMWRVLNDIADREQGSINDICSLVQLGKKQNTSLTAAIRVFIVLYLQKATTEEGHRQAGHGNLTRMITRAGAHYLRHG